MKFLILSMLLIAHSTCAQEKESNFDRIADDLISSDSDEDEATIEARYENLTQLLSNPIDLNKVSPEDLRQLYVLNESQINQLISYRSEYGPFVSIYELQAVPGFDQNVINALAPFVKISDAKNQINSSLAKRLLSSANSYMILRWDKALEARKGFTNDVDSSQRYQGSDQRFFTRYRSSQPNDYSFGFTLEKDPGEQFQWSPERRKFGGDYNSAHIQLLNKWKIKNLIIGDFQAQFAQGLVLGGSFGLGKGAETITTTRRTGIGFVPHTSAGESGFYRGIASTIQLHKYWRMSAFASRIRRDASVTETENAKAITAFQFAGSHRNENEKKSEQAAAEVAVGSVLHYARNSFDAGLLVQRISFQFPIEKQSSLYNQFAFAGRENLNTGIFYNYTVNNFCIFGEAAKSFYGGTGVVAGAIGSLTSSLDISVLFRNYSKTYYAFYANPFSENTQPQNETGVYWGVKYKWNRRWTLSSYVDLFKFPWLAFRRYRPSSGYEWLGRITFQPSRKMTMFAQIRQESKERNFSEESTQYLLGRGVKTNYWASFNYAEGIIRMRTRVQYSTFKFNRKTSGGIVLLQGLGFEVGKFQLTAHYALFQTDDFDNRQYVYENDVYLVFSLPSYDGNGVRTMLMLQYALSKKLSIYARYARTYYHEKEEIGTGLEMISGNTKNDVKFQAVLRF